MILEKQSKKFDSFTTDSYVTINKLLKVLEEQKHFKDELVKLFKIDESTPNVIQIGNSKSLLDSIFSLDSQCEKQDINSKINKIELKKMLEKEKAIFEIAEITNESILKRNKSDLLLVETSYSAKQDILDYYSLSKFANYCRDLKYESLINYIKDYLKQMNIDNEDERSLRLVYKKEDKKYYLRAVTSKDIYKNFGINFSVFVALIALNLYKEKTETNIYIDNYVVNDSEIYVSFSFNNSKNIGNNLILSFNLILENDEIKRKPVTFNGVFKLTFKDKEKSSDIFLKPKGLKRDETSYPVDLLTYKHSGSVEKVFEKIKDLPELIDFFIKQVSEDALKISSIKNTKDVKLHLANKVKYAKNVEFKKYKESVYNKLMRVTTENTFTLFEIFREIEELFDNEDVVSRDYWREKLYESLIEKK